MGNLISDKFKAWDDKCNARFNRLKSNEEALNQFFIDIYGLQDELLPEIDSKDVTVRRANLEREIKSLLSYAVGCMFGRYSLDKDGLCFSGGIFDDMYVSVKTGKGYTNKHQTNLYLREIVEHGDTEKSFGVNVDNVIPITDDEYFENDIVNRVVEFIRVAYGEDTVEENLDFIAQALGGKGTSRDVIRAYFIDGFYRDHVRIYQKRPIYWMFSSGKHNSFKCLIYIHRYQSDLIARIRTDYIHEIQARYLTAITNIEAGILEADGSEATKLKRVLKKIKDQEHELHQYEAKIHHLADQRITIDLNDGIKENYLRFGDVLASL